VWVGTAGAARWTDALGRQVEVAERPQRIVSLVPSVTEILFAMGLGDRVVGVTRFCDYPAEAAAKPKVGGYADPSLETVIGMAPDLVFGSADATKPALVSRFETLAIPVYVVYPRSVTDTVKTLQAVGSVAGAPEAGRAAAADLEGAVARVQEAVAGLPRPRVLLCVMVKPLVVAGPGTLGDDLIRLAGGQNVVPPSSGRYPTWGSEAVLAADPDVIIVTTMVTGGDPAAYFRQWPELRAVAGGRVREILGDWVHRPGPRLALGLQAVAEAIHGQAFSPGRP